MDTVSLVYFQSTAQQPRIPFCQKIDHRIVGDLNERFNHREDVMGIESLNIK